MRRFTAALRPLGSLQTRTLTTVPLATLRPVISRAPQSIPVQHRFLSKTGGGAGAFKSNKDISYDELKPLTEQPSDDVVIIDVREPDEVMMGSIPSAVNVPLSNFEKALSMDPADFTKKFGFHKPGKDQKLVMFCLAGKRSQTATDLAKGKGYKFIRNYPGSYEDWQRHQKQN